MIHRDAPRAGRTRWRRLAIVLTPGFLVGTLAFAPAAPSAAAPRTEDPPSWTDEVRVRTGDHPARLASSLHDDADAPARSVDTQVVVEATNAAAARRAIEDAGGEVEVALTDRVQGTVAAGRLDEVAEAEGVVRVREPARIRPHVLSEGVADTQASAWQTGGFDGTGQKIAILDGGFTGYASKLGTELPASVETDFSRCGPGGSEHGTAVAEIVHDMAPGAQLRLVCIQTDVEYVSALGTMAANGVDVVNGSFGFFMLSRGDGSGSSSTVAGATHLLRTQGILYVASAGNSGDSHYNVNANGDPTPGEFDDFVNISDGDALEVTVPGGGVVFIGLSWDLWPTTRQDFDMYVGNDTCGLVGASEEQQDIPGGLPPLEGTVFANCSGSTQVFEVLVNRWAGAATPRLDFIVDGDVIGIEHTSGGSIAEPASSPAAFAVGAYCEANGSVQPYSSTGPSIDGRIEPDISGPDGTSSSVYGAQSGCFNGFTGTSASAPHVAGAAALVLEANPLLDVAELQQLLEDRAQDAGAAGDDNSYGAGRLRLGTSGDAYRPAPQSFTGMDPTRLFDSRPGQPAYPGESPSRTTPLGPNGTVRIKVRDVAGVPDDAVAVVLNLTAVGPTAAGWATIFPSGTVPTASNVNFAPGQTAAVHVTATVAPDDKVALNNALGSTNFIVDIAGWYGPTGDGGPSTDRLTPLASPARAMDTRGGTPLGYAEGGGAGHTTPIGPDDELDIQVAGLGGVPADATAVVMNATAIAPTSGTFLTAFPTGSPRPTASNLNAKAGQTVANLIVIPVGPGGFVTYYNQLGNTHLAVDVIGYFRAGTGAGYVPLDPPTRNLDTRTGNGLRLGSLGVNGTHKLRVGRYHGVPGDAVAVMLSVVAVSPSAAGWLTVYSGTASLPTASNVNFAAGSTIANAALAALGADDTVAFNNAKGSTHVISDLAGYFIDPANVQLPPP